MTFVLVVLLASLVLSAGVQGCGASQRALSARGLTHEVNSIYLSAVGGATRAGSGSDATRGLGCFGTPSSLSSELRTIVKPASGPAVDGDAATEAARLAGKHFPYSNSYCRARADRFLELRPVDCELAPFRAEPFLETIRGRRLVLWGDSVQRQFFTYLAVRLEELETSRPAELTTKAHYRRVGRGCAMRRTAHPVTGLQLNEPCFRVATDWSKHCHTYHGNATSLCFVRTDGDVVDDRCAPIFNNTVYIATPGNPSSLFPFHYPYHQATSSHHHYGNTIYMITGNCDDCIPVRIQVGLQFR